MLIQELIARHVRSPGALHVRGLPLEDTQVPPGLSVHRDGDDAVAPQAGDLVLVGAPLGLGLRERVDTDLPVGATVLLLFEAELTELPVSRVLAVLGAARLQVVEAAVVAGLPALAIAVVATRTDELVVPAPHLAHALEPGEHNGTAALRRVLGEYALAGLVQPARERLLSAQVRSVEAQVGDVTAELEKLRADGRAREAALVKDIDIARKEAGAARKEAGAARKEAGAARKEADTERKRMQSLRASTSFKVAARLARMSGVARRVVPRRRPGKARS